jgi:hypothetical protein
MIDIPGCSERTETLKVYNQLKYVCYSIGKYRDVGISLNITNC